MRSAPELSRTVEVAPDGQIYVPYVGGLMAAGLTVDALQVAIRDALESELKAPVVEVLLIDPGGP